MIHRTLAIACFGLATIFVSSILEQLYDFSIVGVYRAGGRGYGEQSTSTNMSTLERNLIVPPNVLEFIGVL